MEEELDEYAQILTDAIRILMMLQSVHCVVAKKEKKKRCSFTNLRDEKKVKSKETVGNSGTVLKVILGHKYHHNH